jgi:hypothetical protein
MGGKAPQVQFWFSCGMDDLTGDGRDKRVSKLATAKPRNNNSRNNKNWNNIIAIGLTITVGSHCYITMSLVMQVSFVLGKR